MKLTETKLRKIIQQEIAKLTEADKEVYQVRLGIDKREDDWKDTLKKLEKHLERNVRGQVDYDTQTFTDVKNLHATFEDRREAEEFEKVANNMDVYSEFETLYI